MYRKLLPARSASVHDQLEDASTSAAAASFWLLSHKTAVVSQGLCIGLLHEQPLACFAKLWEGDQSSAYPLSGPDTSGLSACDACHTTY